MSGSRVVARQGSGSPAKRRSSSSVSQPNASAGAADAAEQQIHIQNPHHFSNNMGVVYFLRIYMTIVAGAAVGILGVEGWAGFGAYIISQLLCTIPVLVKCGGNYTKYLHSWDKACLEHIFSSTAILSYILFWMIFYNICHVF